MELIDSHAHLEFPAFDPDRDEMLARARVAGITTILAIGSGTGPERLDAGLEFARTHDWIYATVGIHPHEARLAEDRHFAALEEMAREPRVIAWGEIGLDYHYDHSPRDIQRAVFLRQLDLAAAARLPIVIHCREAWEDSLDLFEQRWRPTGLGGILHCFTGTLAEARRGLDLGFMVSFAGNLTYPKAQPLREVAREIPLDRLLIETDSPFLPPQSRRGKRNEPAFLLEVARELGNVRDLPADEVARITTRNFRQFFRLGSAGAAPGS